MLLGDKNEDAEVKPEGSDPTGQTHNIKTKVFTGILNIFKFLLTSRTVVYALLGILSAFGLREVIITMNFSGSGIDGSPAARPSLFTVILNFKDKSPSHKTNPVPSDAGIINFMRREEWGAAKSKGKLEEHRKGLDHVVISHTADIGNFTTTEQCAKGVKTAQEVAFIKGFDDISYNYLVGNDGVVYVGRGWKYVPATAKGWNKNSLGVAFIGKYVQDMPSAVALDACKGLLQLMVDEGILQPDFSIHCLRQVRPNFPVAPGDPLYQEIQTWKGQGHHNTWSWKEVNPVKEPKFPQSKTIS